MSFKDLLHNVFNGLSESLAKENTERMRRGSPTIDAAEIRIVGQCALLLKDLPFPIAGSIDLDASIRGDFWVRSTLERLLTSEGLALDSDAHLIWMPDDTRYELTFTSPLLKVLLADPDAVIASKCKFRRSKDRDLIRNYLQHFPQAKEALQRWGISWTWVGS